MELGIETLPLDVEAIERFKAEIKSPQQPKKPAKTVESRSLSDMNLEKELVEQYFKIKGLMDEVADDDNIPANQRAQVANSVVSALQALVKLQEDLQRGERLKLMETCLIDALKVLPEETKAGFFENYERLAKKAGLLK